ncbi:hypothetical protein H0H92_005037 [Tricholoma furcatifolium]|nr:hypothetical protein H0H92_005037 [Tricholoma furcatifolium]
MALYFLPSHPSLKSLDPLGVTSVDEPTVWEVIVATISSVRDAGSDISHLPALIENLVYSVHNNGQADTGYLRKFLTSVYPNPSDIIPQTIFNKILDHALALPAVYPSHTLEHLSGSHPVESVAPEQMKCLVSHQFLGTLSPPQGNTWGCTFLNWYSEPQPLENAIHGYLTTLFHFFLHHPSEQSSVTYRYVTAPLLQLDTNAPFWENSSIPVFDHLVIEGASGENIKFPHETLRSMLIASNKSPGFGASCTQEELITGACPELLPLGALFIRPPVPDDAAIVAHGIRPLTEWRDKGRNAHVVDCRITEDRCTFLLLDALELDHSDTLSPLLDLLPENLSRELLKAYIGFSVLRLSNITDIASPLWGAGAFGGDPIAKALILSMAGALAGVRIFLSIDDTQVIAQSSPSTGTSQSKVIDILNTLKRDRASLTVGYVWARLNADDGRTSFNGLDLVNLL